jgi:catechol 2,3-dioxygenase-like lactoylglutathione lyase family enzyme
MMDLKNSSTALFVRDITISKNFYVDILGLKVNLDFGKNIIFENGFAIWEIQEDHIIPVTLGLDRITDLSSNRFELYFETENFSQVYETLKSQNVKFLHEIHEEPWGQLTIRFFDPDDHLIEIGESMRQFVRRFYDQGLTLEQVSKRTFIPVEEVKRLINIK